MPADKRNALTLAELDNNKHRMSSFYDANSYRQIAVLIFCLIELSKAAFIDRSTPLNHLTKLRRRDNRRLGLVMSDEFSLDNREFGVGEDSMFEALDRPDNSNDGNAYYNSSKEYATTIDGALVITTKPSKMSWYQWDASKLSPVRYVKNYTSAMIQTWNKFCFTGGVLELSVQLPGSANGGGLWPAVWLMGNLGRAAFPSSNMNIWPWSYSRCDEIPHLLYKQEINACNGNPGFGLNPFQGRGAPEIDIFEAMSGLPSSSAFISSSLQVAPGIVKERRPRSGYPLNDSYQWYDSLRLGPQSSLNSGFWGQECGAVHSKYKYMQDAISANVPINDSHYSSFHNYKLEWQPGKDGYLDWYLDDELIFGLNANSLARLTGSVIPEEPMYLILNTAVSHRWGMPEPCPQHTCSACYHCYDCTNPDCQCALPEGMRNCANFPARMKIDYIRIYQDVSDPLHSLGCSPRSHPTSEFIARHAERYYGDWYPWPLWMVTTYGALLNALWLMILIVLSFGLLKCCVRCDHFIRTCIQQSQQRKSYTAIV